LPGITAEGRMKAAGALWINCLLFMWRVIILTTGKVVSKYIPSSKHIIGKSDTWRIERLNLNFRTHIKRLNRRTICFSKDEKIHDNVIGMTYQPLLF
jgi:insertion element IS1 protein InsB